MKKRVFLFEDSQWFAEDARRFLETGGFEVEWAADGNAAYGLMQRAIKGEIPMPDAIITDVNMPAYDIALAIPHMRTHFPGVPVLVQSGSYSDPDMQTFINKLEPDIFMPPNEADFAREVNKQLAKKQAAGELGEKQGPDRFINPDKGKGREQP
jgi:CheY-like chemotaxis protein